MLTTLFTGHTVPLIMMAYVSPILQETRSAGLFENQKVMYIHIGIMNSPPIRHEFIKCDMFGQMSDEQAAAWEITYDTAVELRHQLIADWEAALHYQPSRYP